jgi:hypothetical protein
MTGTNWLKARADYEQRGLSLQKVATAHGVSVNAVTYHKKKEGWSRDGAVPELPAEAVTASFTPEQRVKLTELPAAQEVEYQRRIAELEEQLAEAERKAAEYRPTHEHHIYRSVDEVRTHFGEERLREIAALRLAQINRGRMSRGLPTFNYEDRPELYEQEIRAVLTEMLARRTQFVNPQQSLRVVKMALRGKDGEWSLRQIPVEVQISNEAGQSGAAMWKARDKGFKLVMPYLCQRLDCWREATVGPDGKFAHHGYCGPEHEGMDPYLNRRPVAGVTTSRASALVG